MLNDVKCPFVLEYPTFAVRDPDAYPQTGHNVNCDSDHQQDLDELNSVENERKLANELPLEHLAELTNSVHEARGQDIFEYLEIEAKRVNFGVRLR